MTVDELEAVNSLQHVSYPVASWDKRFARSLSGMTTISEKEVPQVWRLFRRYRRQFSCPNKERLLLVAERLSAPDFRKQRAESSRLAELQDKYQKAMAQA